MPDEAVDPELRGWVARQMVSQDARWALDVVLSSGKRSELGPFVDLLLSHHFVRIAYEGAIALRSPTEHVGVPQFADLLNEQFGPITRRVRNVAKLLDDTKKTYETVVDNLEAIARDHGHLFIGSVKWWARWLATDIGLCLAGDKLVGATVPMAYRLGVDFAHKGRISEQDFRTVCEEWGRMLTVLSAASFNDTKVTATLDLARVPRVQGVDRRSNQYFSSRFEPEFPIGLKMLLITIEGEINTLRTIVVETAPGHESSTFRVCTVALYHCLSTLRHILDRHAGLNSSGIRRVRQLMADASVAVLLSTEGKKLRNRCMHYEIPDPTLALDPTRQMFGIVEAVYSGKSMRESQEEMDAVAERVGDMLEDWSPSIIR